MAKHGTIWWTELQSRDPDKARGFYRKVIGWKPFVAAVGNMQKKAKPGEPSYTIFSVGDQPACGAFKLEGPEMEGVPPHWFTYIAVDNVDKACGKVERAGGKVARPPFDVPGVGRIAIISDPEGAMVGLGTPAPPARPAKKKAAAKKKRRKAQRRS
jgi:predicted enzyme related to lactoylglutathione lyase